MLKKFALIAFAAVVCSAAPAAAQVRIGVDGGGVGVRLGDDHRGHHVDQGYRGDRGYRGGRVVVRERSYRDRPVVVRRDREIVVRRAYRERDYRRPRGRTVIIER